MLVMEGYRKDDPNDIISLDKYRLVLAEGGKSLEGKTWNHGGWGSVAKIILRRKAAGDCLDLCCYLKQACDKLRLSHCISSIQSFHLPLTHHIHCLNPLYCPLGSVERAIAQTCSHSLLNEPMVLFDDIIEVLYSPELTVMRQHLLLL